MIKVKIFVLVREALYEGSYNASTLPAYQPKDYDAECQRYNIDLGQQSVQGWCYNWGRLAVHIPLPVAIYLSSPTVILTIIKF